MKANEAPEKIYLQDSMSTDTVGELWPEWFDAKISDYSIEYIRTDAFIEKALKWYCLDCECNNNCNADYKCFFRQEYKRYLEGDNSAIPPKFDNAINPDGSLTENYRYRHFIQKVRDAFIEKALRWMISQGGVNDALSREMIEDFKTYMKRE